MTKKYQWNWETGFEPKNDFEAGVMLAVDYMFQLMERNLVVKLKDSDPLPGKVS